MGGNIEMSFQNIIYWSCPEGHHTKEEPPLTSYYHNSRYHKCNKCNKSYSKDKWNVEEFRTEDPEIHLDKLSYEELKQLKKREVKV